MESTPKLMSLIVIATILTAAPAAACDITQLPCWDNGKCNIQFKNHTGDASGDSGKTSIDQTSSATTIEVKALKNGDKVGNKLTISAGAKNTMNIENKYEKGFDSIKVNAKNNAADSFTMSCGVVKAVLDGNGTCKVFHGETGESSNLYVLGYKCDGGDVYGPLSFD